MATVIGALLDTSGSMRRYCSTSGNKQSEPWARSIFTVVDNLVKHDVSQSNKVFALGFGASGYQPECFDLLGTAQKVKLPDHHHLPKNEILEMILHFLERNGAPRVRKWASVNIISQCIKHFDASIVLDKLQNDELFRTKFVNDCLPESCRKSFNFDSKSFFSDPLLFCRKLGNESAIFSINKAKSVTKNWGLNISRVEKIESYATKESVEIVVKKGMTILPSICVNVSRNAIMGVHTASDILRGQLGEEELTTARVDKMLGTIKPLIYGRTPLMEMLSYTTKLFNNREFTSYKKLLFILSDGCPSDGNNPPIKSLTGLGVTTVCCLITHNSIREPKRLYSTECEDWNLEAKLMFKMSSVLTTQMIPRTLFVKRGWTIDFINNETRLFVQVNHPDLIEDVCELARDVVCCQEALSDVLSTIELDVYINKANEGFEPPVRTASTCYANACATVMHLAMERILGRDGGCPDFFYLRRCMIKKYGDAEQGANTWRVIRETCPQYRLRCRKVDILGAMEAISAKRPVLAKFQLPENKIEAFHDFYQNNPKGILRKSDLDKSTCPWKTNVQGHAMVLTSFNSECLRFMNSWGSDWADGGFFKVENADVLELKFVDVFWDENKATPDERDNFRRNGAIAADKLMKSLKGLQTAVYICPLCNNSSSLLDYTGHPLEATCPRCNGQFSTQNAEDLAMNLYLLSLLSTTRSVGTN